MIGKTNSSISSIGANTIKNSKQNKYLTKIGTSISKNNFVEIGSQTQKSTLLKTLNTVDYNNYEIIYEADNEWLISCWGGSAYYVALVRMINDSFIISDPYTTEYTANPVVLGKIGENSWVIMEVDNSSYRYVRVVTFDGTKLVKNNQISTPVKNKVALVSNNKILIVGGTYHSGTYKNGYYEIYGTICTISGTTITEGSETLIGTTTQNNDILSSSAAIEFTLFPLTDSRCLISMSYRYTSNNSWGNISSEYAVIGCKISGNTATVTNFVTTTQYMNTLCIQLSTNNIIGVYISENQATSYRILGVVYSSNTLKAEAKENYYAKQEDKDLTYSILSDTELIFFDNNNSYNYIHYVKLNTSTAIPTVTEKLIYTSSVSGKIKLDSSTFITTYANNSAIYCDKVTVTNGTVNIERLANIPQPNAAYCKFYNVYDNNKNFYFYYNEDNSSEPVRTTFIEYVSGELNYYTKTITEKLTYSPDFSYFYYDSIHDRLLMMLDSSKMCCIGIHEDYEIFNVKISNGFSSQSDNLMWNVVGDKVYQLTYGLPTSGSGVNFIQNEYQYINNELAIPGKCIELASTKIDGVLINDATDSIAGTVLELA